METVIDSMEAETMKFYERKELHILVVLNPSCILKSLWNFKEILMPLLLLTILISVIYDRT